MKILKVEPSSYTPCIALLKRGLSSAEPLAGRLGRWFGSKSGKDASDITRPVSTSIKIAAAPLAFKSRIPPSKTCSTAAWIDKSIVNFSGFFA